MDLKVGLTPVDSHISSETNSHVAHLPRKNVLSQLFRKSSAFNFFTLIKKKAHANSDFCPNLLFRSTDLQSQYMFYSGGLQHRNPVQFSAVDVGSGRKLPSAKES